MVNTSFVAQAAPDIRRKLRKVEGFTRMNITQLIEVTSKIFMNREVEAEREAKTKKERHPSHSSTKRNRSCKDGKTPITKRGKPRAPLARDQCAYCKEKRHWKNECPNRKGPSKPSQYWEEPRGEEPRWFGWNRIRLRGTGPFLS